MKSILHIGIKEDNLLIKAEGEMRAIDSFALNQFLKPYLEKTELNLNIVIDLSNCHYMDSTFIGFILSLENKCHLYNPNCVRILNPNKKIQRGLKGLSILDKLNIEFDAEVPNITTFKLSNDAIDYNSRENIAIVFDAHRRLSEISEKNREEFKDLMTELQRVLDSKNS